MFRLKFEWGKSTWVSVLLLVLLFPVALTLPEEYSFENHLIENLQVVVLLGGFVMTLRFVGEMRDYVHIRNFWLTALPIWLIMALRELSWGRAFYPVGMTEDGPVFISLQDLWYGPAVHPTLGVVIVVLLFFAWKHLRALGGRTAVCLSVVDMALFVALSLASQMVFEKGVISALKPYSQMLEECAELISYWCLVSAAHIAMRYHARAAHRLDAPRRWGR